jgi:hypothetical protein
MALPSRASAQQLQQSQSQNLQNCLEDFSSCDRAKLNAQGKQEVLRESRDRNFMECFSVFFGLRS